MTERPLTEEECAARRSAIVDGRLWYGRIWDRGYRDGAFQLLNTIDALRAEVGRLRLLLDQHIWFAGTEQEMLEACPDAECDFCAVIVCPHNEPMHFHHDGCPSCWARDAEIKEQDDE